MTTKTFTANYLARVECEGTLYLRIQHGEVGGVSGNKDVEWRSEYSLGGA